jgi:hypothetical protein
MTDLERIEKVNRMQKIGAVIWKPTLVPYVEMKVEKDGKVLTHINKLCESFNRNAFNVMTQIHLRCNFMDATFGSGKLSLKGTTGSIQSTSNFCVCSLSNATVGILYCIVLGTGVGAESFEGYALETPILHGNTTGKLAYQTSGVSTKAWTVGTLTWEIDHVRVFNNNSGGLITINEVCLYYTSNWYGTSYAMLLRDLLAVGVDVPDAAQLTVTYHLQMVFPE